MSGTITCPACGATNPAAALWCSLCHTSFATRDAPSTPAPTARPDPEPPPEVSIPRQGGAGREPAVPPSDVDPDQWVALLAAEEHRRPSRFEQAMTRRSARVLFVLGVIGAVLLVSLVGMALLVQLTG